MNRNKTMDILNNLFLEVKSEIGNLHSLENLDKYEKNKKRILEEIDNVKCRNSEELILKDKIKIYYRFCDNKIIEDLKRGNSYKFIK